jgi:hypothetical protein
VSEEERWHRMTALARALPVESHAGLIRPLVHLAFARIEIPRIQSFCSVTALLGPPMPLAGSTHSALSKDDAPYFTTLTELDEWADTHPSKLEGVVPYPEGVDSSSQQGRLLVRCLDFCPATRR